MSIIDIEEDRAVQAPRVPTGNLGYLSGVLTIFRMELIQRLRTRGWYILLGIWVVVVTGVVLLLGAGLRAQEVLFEQANAEAGEAAASAERNPLLALADASVGQQQFELAAGFVLAFGALIAPVLAANAISGDRAAGTLAVVQATLARPGQIMWGKWLAAWAVSLLFLLAAVPAFVVAAAGGLSDWLSFFLVLLAIVVEFGVLCGLGVGISALTTRPLFSILATYLVVGLLFVGTAVTAGIASMTMRTEVRFSDEGYSKQQEEILGKWDGKGEDPLGNIASMCQKEVQTVEEAASDRFAWVLAANPVVLVADLAVPPSQQVREKGTRYAGGDQESTVGQFGAVSTFVRTMQAGPQAQVRCLAGKLQPAVELDKQPPVWPLGLAVQGMLVACVVLPGRQRLVTPAGRLAAGTRVA